MYVEEWTEAMNISYTIMYHAKNKRTIWILSLHSDWWTTRALASGRCPDRPTILLLYSSLYNQRISYATHSRLLR